jgi:hypothetical protein
MARRRKKFKKRRNLTATVEVININTRQRKVIDLKQKEKVIYNEKLKTYDVITSGSAIYDINEEAEENLHSSGSVEIE